jgi:hypothetical protein
MKMLLVAAALTAALNSSMIWADAIVSAFQGASEPVGLVMWGVALFVIAGSLKKRPASSSAARTRSESGERSWISGMLPNAGDRSREVGLDARKLEART